MLARYDQWLKGRDTGVIDGPPIRYQIPGAEGWLTATDWPPQEAVLTPFPLCADGTLGREEGPPGSLAYLHLPVDSGVPANAGPADLPTLLAWETAPFDADLTLAGNFELTLEASITALDTSWIAVLYDVPPEGAAEPITAGWLRASLRTIDEARSLPGPPVIDCRTPVALPVGERVTYRIPLVPNARHLPAGHGLRLVIASADETEKYPTVLGFTHVPVREASRNTIVSASRLLLPVLPGSGKV